MRRFGVGRRQILVLVMISGIVLSWSCRKDEDEIEQPTPVVEQSVHIEPQPGIYLRTGFDSDPSDFIGRFISDDVPADMIDENRGRQTRCSQFIEFREVRAGGTYDEIYRASRSAGATLDVASIAEVAGVRGDMSGGTEEAAAVRVKYELTRIMRGSPTEEYWDCCDRNVGQCSGRYLSEFRAGTGTIYQMLGSQKALEAGVVVPATVGTEVVYENEVAWQRTMEFEDLYFAFAVAEGAAFDDCGWVNNIPVADDGIYVVGHSPRVASESRARTLARRNARQQVVEYLGEYIESSSTTTISSMDRYLEDEEIINTMAEGVAERVQVERYCPPEEFESPEGPLYSTYVLGFFSEDETKEALLDTIAEMEKKLDETGDLSEEEQMEFDEVRRQLRGDE